MFSPPSLPASPLCGPSSPPAIVVMIVMPFRCLLCSHECHLDRFLLYFIFIFARLVISACRLRLLVSLSSPPADCVSPRLLITSSSPCLQQPCCSAVFWTSLLTCPSSLSLVVLYLPYSELPGQDHQGPQSSPGNAC